MRRLTQEQFISTCAIKHNGTYCYEKCIYKSQNDTVIITCKAHGDFEQLAGNHIRGSGCPLCANAIRNINVKLTPSLFEERVAIRNQSYSPLIVIGDYVNMKTKILMRCMSNHERLMWPQDVLAGHDCMICAHSKRETFPTQLHIPAAVLNNLKSKKWLVEQHYDQQKTLEQISKEIGVTPKCVASYIEKHNIDHRRFNNSQIEREVYEFITTELDIRVISNTRTVIPPQEIDLWIPSHNIAIEINGIYWHGELSNRDKLYHIKKTNECRKKGIRLLHIWDNDWIQKKHIIQSKISHVLGLTKNTIFARCCTVREIKKNEATNFIDQNHFQGKCSASLNFGLFYQDELVAVMTFDSARYNKQFQYEMIRFCTKQNYHIIGGGGKLHRFFENAYHPMTIISYCDLRYGTGSLYTNLGYNLMSTSAPNYFYFKRNQSNVLYSRIKFQKHKLEKLLDVYDSELTEWENMINNGYDRVWDCGNNVYVWRRC